MNSIILGNIIAFIGCLIMVSIGLIKTKRNILLTQNIQFLIQGIANFLLGGISGVIANIVSISRNFICLKWNLNWPLKILFIAIQAGLTLWTNNMGIPGWLPFVAAVILTCILDTRNEIILKTAIILGEICWIIYDILISNYIGCAFDIFTVITNFIGILMIIYHSHNKKAPL